MNKRKQEKPGGREVGTLPAHLSLSWECLLVPLAAVSRPTWSKNQTGARKWGPEHPHPRSQDPARVVAVARLPTQPLSPMASGCLRPSHTASKLLCGHLPWQAMMENSREAKGSSSALGWGEARGVNGAREHLSHG